MLANGSTIKYAAIPNPDATPSSWTNSPDLQELPDIGADPELIDNTALSDSIKHNEMGIGDPGDMEFKFRYDNSSANASYRVAKSISGKKYFQVKLYDGTTYVFKAIPNVKVAGGGVNDPIEFTMSLALQSDIAITDPA